MKSESKPATSLAISRCGLPGPEFLQDPVEEQIAGFLNGRTHGEELLHALFDHILDEPVPERLRALFKK